MIHDAELYEPVTAVITADSSNDKADNTIWPTADGGLLKGASDSTDPAIWAEIYEPVRSPVTADATPYTADNTIWPTADGGLPDGASDYIDADVIAASVPIGEMGGRIQLRRLKVVGRGFGVLPPLDGEGDGLVAVIGSGAARLPRLAGDARGASVVAGELRARLVVVDGRATGVRGEVGIAVAVFRTMGANGHGLAVVRGAGSGTIEVGALAIGQHDDEDAAIMTVLLAA